MSKDDVPMAVQTATAKDIEDSGAIDLSDFMNRRMTGVYVNNNCGEPFQPDLNYRGYTVSPLPERRKASRFMWTASARINPSATWWRGI